MRRRIDRLEDVLKDSPNNEKTIEDLLRRANSIGQSFFNDEGEDVGKKKPRAKRSKSRQSRDKRKMKKSKSKTPAAKAEHG